MNFRSARVSKLIREELSLMIVREMEFPGALVTVTSVEIDKKLEHARVEVSVIPSSAAADALEALEKRAGYFQHLLQNRKMLFAFGKNKRESSFGYCFFNVGHNHLIAINIVQKFWP